MSRLLLTTLALAASSAACATILDFKEPTDRVSATDAGPTTLAARQTDEAKLDAASDPPGDASDDASVEAPVATQTDAASGAAVDVAVETCACPPAVTADWRGPFVIAQSNGGAPPACSGGYPVEVYAGYADANAPAAQCACSCDAPNGVACTAPTTTFFSDKACTSTCQAVATTLTCVTAASYACDLLSLTKPKAMTVGGSVASGGSCAPSANATVPPQTWASSIRLCGSDANAATCADGGCAVPPSAGFSPATRCVMKAGAADCPAAYPARRSFHQSGSDTRGCSACTCGAQSGATCGPTVSIFNNSTTCASPDAVLQTPADCVAVTPTTRLTLGGAVAQGGACAPSGGTATGGFVEDDPTTVCCLD